MREPNSCILSSPSLPSNTWIVTNMKSEYHPWLTTRSPIQINSFWVRVVDFNCHSRPPWYDYIPPLSLQLQANHPKQFLQKCFLNLDVLHFSWWVQNLHKKKLWSVTTLKPLTQGFALYTLYLVWRMCLDLPPAYHKWCNKSNRDDNDKTPWHNAKFKPVYLKFPIQHVLT